MQHESWQNVLKWPSFNMNRVRRPSFVLSMTEPILHLDVMQVAHHFFENGIAYFTRRINKCISLACANGDVAPFVGHNAFLRWSAIQEAAFVDKDGITKVWSESNVSEDFDMALRLQVWPPTRLSTVHTLILFILVEGIYHPLGQLLRWWLQRRCFLDRRR